MRSKFNEVKAYLLCRPALIRGMGVGFLVALLALGSPTSALAAFDPNAAALNILGFIKLLILVACAVVAVTMILRSQVIPAIIAMLAGAFLMTVLDPDVMKAIGDGIKGLLEGSKGA